MKKLCSVGIAALLMVALVGCGDEDHHDHQDHGRVGQAVDILSDPTLDGDITKDLATGLIGTPSVATNTGNVLAGIDVSPVTGVSISESRGFLIFPLRQLPSNASVQFASITVFLNDVFFVGSSTSPIPFLLDSIDTVAFPPPIVGSDFDSAFLMSRSLSFFGRDAGTFVEINVTSLLADAQARLLPEFEVRLLFDQARILNDPTTTEGLIEIDDRAANTSRAPNLHVEFF